MPGNRNITRPPIRTATESAASISGGWAQDMADRQAVAMDTELREAFTTGTNQRWDIAGNESGVDSRMGTAESYDRYKLSVRDTGSYRLNTIAIIEKALGRVESRDQVRILDYVLSGLEGVETDVDS